MAHYSIGEFAKKTGLPIPTLRYYEQEKLIYSHREENNRRYYDDSDTRTFLHQTIPQKNTS